VIDSLQLGDKHKITTPAVSCAMHRWNEAKMVVSHALTAELEEG